MYKKNSVRKLGKPADERNALIRSQLKDLIKNGHISTTKARGKEVIKKLDSLMSDIVDNKLKGVKEYIGDDMLIGKLSKIPTKKKSGNVTMVEVKNRAGDNSEKVLIELIK